MNFSNNNPDPQACDCAACRSAVPEEREAIQAIKDLERSHPEELENIVKIATYVVGLQDAVKLAKKMLIIAADTMDAAKAEIDAAKQREERRNRNFRRGDLN